jgi:DNA-binding IclR family transcriptional regulator
VRRASEILHFLAESGGHQGVSALARALGMQASTALHILRELSVSSLVSFEPVTRTWALGPAVLTLARQFQDGDAFAVRAQGEVDAIGRRFRVKATASMFDGHGHIVVVAASAADDDELQVQISPGRRVPMLASSTGRCIAAFNPLDERTLRAAFAHTRWHRPLAFDAWMKQVEKVRRDGYAVDEGWYRKGITLLSVPVRATDGCARHFVGALAISAQLDAASRRRLVDALQEAAERLAPVIAAAQDGGRKSLRA